jgi:hypothetical protein
MGQKGERVSALEALSEADRRMMVVLADNLQQEMDRRMRTAAEAREMMQREMNVSIVSAQRAQDKFEQDIVRRFDQVNEFREALSDLGKSMATRRELEAGMDAIRNERNSLVSSNEARISEIIKSVAELRSRLDVGPTELKTLQERSYQNIGAERKQTELVHQRQAVTNLQIAAFSAFITFVLIIFTIVVKFI